jgi:hypothetical protein
MKDNHISVRLEPDQKRALEAAASLHGTTVGDLVRRSVTAMLGQTARPSRPILKKTLANPRRERELAWLADHRTELKAHRGEYLVIEGETLVAHGRDLQHVLMEARSKGIHTPFVERIAENMEAPDYWMGL